MSKFRVAVIGCGAVSKNHGKALSKSERAELVYAVDIDFNKAKVFAETYGGEPLDDYHKIPLDKVDAVHVVTPHNSHREITEYFLERGINVFSEKPLAITPYDAKHIVATASASSARLAVCFQNRVNGSTIQAKEIIDSGKYGRVISAMALVGWERKGKYYSESPWRGTYEGEGGGVLINQSIHTLDLLDYLAGPVLSITGFDGKFRETDDYEVEDFGMARAELKGGAEGVIFATNCYPKSKICTVEIHLERALLTVKQSGLLVEAEGEEPVFYPQETATGEKSEWGLSHGRLIEAFYDSLKNNTEFVAEGRTGLAAVEIVNAIQHSKGRKIMIGGNYNE